MSFRFTVTADIRDGAGDYSKFINTCKSINNSVSGPGSFHVTLGNTDDVSTNRRAINNEFGGDFIWVPIVGDTSIF